MVQAAPNANVSMTGNAPTFATLLLRVFLPFAFAYFLSYIFRGVNAVIFPYLERDIGITAADLGLLTSAFFLFFAAVQPLLGVALDRYGPRKVQAVLLVLAALGSALFGLCTSLARADRGARADRHRLRRRPDGGDQGLHAVVSAAALGRWSPAST